MYDELERLTRNFEKEIERVEGIILRGGEESIPDFVAYKVKCAELRMLRLSLKCVKDVKTQTLKQEFVIDD